MPEEASLYGKIGMKMYFALQELEWEEHQWYKGEKLHHPVNLEDAAVEYALNTYSISYRKRFNENREKLEKAFESGELERIVRDKDKKALHALIGEYTEKDSALPRDMFKDQALS